MVNLIITVGLTTLLYLIFKSFQVLKINTFQAVVFNYITCVLVGSLFSLNTNKQPFLEDLSWAFLSIMMGLMFISAFYLMAWSAQKISVTVSTVSSKMSMILPVMFSFFYLKVEQGNLFFYLTGLVLAIISIYLSTKKPYSQVKSESYLKYASLIFLLSGAVDTSVNFANSTFGGIPNFAQLFPITVFIMASLFGSLLLTYKILIQKNHFSGRSAFAGVFLGIPNYFSIYFLMRTLEDYQGNGAFVFPIISISVIVFSSILAWFIFKEKLTTINILGIVCAVFAIAIISYQEMFDYLAL